MDKKLIVIGYVCVLMYLTIMEAFCLIGYVSLSVGVTVTGLLAAFLCYDRSNHLKKELDEVKSLKKEVGSLKDKISGMNLRM